MRYFIRLSYNGKNYSGWQIQGNAPSVQKTLNEALSVILKEDIHTTGCGRTDTGVHAEKFYAHFDLDKNNELLTTYDLRLTTIYKLNGILPIDIAIHDILPVKDDSNARFDALSRTYKYIIVRHKDPFHNDFAYYLYGKLNVDLMNKAAELMMQYSDFTSFAKLHSQTKTNICKITQAEWKEENNKLIFIITANRFLRNMVRAVVGTLLDVGKEKVNLKEFQNIIESKNRSDAGSSVPPHALYLSNITYPSDIFNDHN